MIKRGKLKTIATIVLMVALMTILVGDSAGSGIWRDMYLENSVASFIGEDSSDRSGFSVTGTMNQGRDLY